MNAQINLILETPENAGSPNERKVDELQYGEDGSQYGSVSLNLGNRGKFPCFVSFLLRCCHDPNYTVTNRKMVEGIRDHLKNVPRANHTLHSLFVDGEGKTFDPCQAAGNRNPNPKALFELQAGKKDPFLKLKPGVTITWEDYDEGKISQVPSDDKTVAVANWFWDKWLEKPDLKIQVQRGESNEFLSNLLPLKAGDKLRVTGKQLGDAGKYFCLLWIDPDGGIEIYRPNKDEGKKKPALVPRDGYFTEDLRVYYPKNWPGSAGVDSAVLLTFSKKFDLAKAKEALEAKTKASVPKVTRNDANRRPIDSDWALGDDLPEVERDEKIAGLQAMHVRPADEENHATEVVRPRVKAFHRTILETLQSLDLPIKHAVLNSNVSIAP